MNVLIVNTSEKEGWKTEGYEGLVHINETFLVNPEFGPNPLHFDLDTIDANIFNK